MPNPWQMSSYEDDDSDDECSHQYQAFDLPTRFLGTIIHRQIAAHGQRNSQQPPPLHININTTTPNARAGASIAVANSTCTASIVPNNNDNATAAAANNHSSSAKQNQNTGPPSPWRNSTAKINVISSLKDGSSDIHLLIGAYGPKNWKDVKFEQIWKNYASRYILSNFTNNMKRLLVNFQTSTGDFEDEASKVEPWFTSVSKVSKAHSLLFLLYMDTTKSHTINNMTAEEIWKSHHQFQQYELEKFKTYNKNMIALTSKRRKCIDEEEAMYRRDMLALPKCAMTSRNLPFWNNHPASELLEKDEKRGIAKTMKPKQLWETREAYQDFPLSIFCKHIYQERTKQLAAPYWQYNRNQKAQKKNIEEAHKLKEEWHQNWFDKGMSEMLDE